MSGFSTPRTASGSRASDPASSSNRPCACDPTASCFRNSGRLRLHLSAHRQLGPPGLYHDVHANSARLAFEQLTLLVKESAEGRELDREDIRRLLDLSVDVVVHMTRRDGRYQISEVYYDPAAKRDGRRWAPSAPRSLASHLEPAPAIEAFSQGEALALVLRLRALTSRIARMARPTSWSAE